MTDLAVTDTHALIWYGLGRSKKLGRRSRSLFERADAGEAALYIPTIVLVEVGEALWRGRISLEGGFESWTEALFASGNFLCVDLTRDIVERAESLYAIPERGDRLIAATAVSLDCPLVTRDEKIGKTAGVETVW